MKLLKLNPVASFLILAIGFVLSFSSGAYAQNVRPVEDGPIHEAFFAPEGGDIILNAVLLAPPRPITERIPAMTDPESEWVPGYWAWQEQLGDFVWVSGVWRRPPPGHLWIPGYWESLDEGWVWFRGFWSPVPYNRLDPLAIAPPDPVNENVRFPPSQDYFWVPGYWQFSYPDNRYVWVGGQWELFDPNWVFVPAHYLWRPDGYIFIPPYWDWPLEARGVVYASVFIPPPLRLAYVFMPVVIIEHPVILEHFFFYFPDHYCFFWHHHHFHPGFWGGFCCSPPWWAWDPWWSFTWYDHWGLWWWWSHPGFPHPFWLDLAMANMLPPPGAGIFPLMGNVQPPLIVTPNGVISPGALLDAISSIMGGKPENVTPILPADPDIKGKILDAAKPELPSTIFKPGGIRDPDPRRQEPKPEIESTLPPGMVPLRPTIPVKPKLPTTRPPIRKPPPASYPPSREPRPPAYYPPRREPRPPTYYPPRPPRRFPWPPREPRPPRMPDRPPMHTPQYPRDEPPPRYTPPMHTPQFPQEEPPPRYSPPTDSRVPPTHTPQHPPTHQMPERRFEPPNLRMPDLFRPRHDLRSVPQTQPPPPMTHPPRMNPRARTPDFRMERFVPQLERVQPREMQQNEPSQEEVY
ncbi:MAG: hypothetical protein ACE5GN_00960 [Waddliaceae bacterium]